MSWLQFGPREDMVFHRRPLCGHVPRGRLRDRSPFVVYQGYVRLHAYGLSNQTLAKWFRDSAIRLAVEMVVGFALTWVPYLLLARSPRRWWLYTGLLSVPFLFATMLVKPIWIDPLFNTFGPMKDKALERSILALAEQAGISGSRVFEVEKSVDTKAINAYVTGVFSTKRIVLWDTLLAKLDEPEVLVVMGHEMGHYVLGHVVRSILLGSLVVLAGLFFVEPRVVADRRFSGRLGFDRLSDVASVPLMLMLIEVSSLVLGPGGHWPTAVTRSTRPTDSPWTDPRQSLRRHGVRQDAVGEPGQPPPRPALQDLSGLPPEHRRSDRLLQFLSSLARESQPNPRSRSRVALRNRVGEDELLA